MQLTTRQKKSNASLNVVNREACNLPSINYECAHPSTFRKNPSRRLRNTFLMEPATCACRPWELSQGAVRKKSLLSACIIN